MSDVNVFLAIGAGLLSFLSPCVLPLIPAYLSFISGASASDVRHEHVRYRNLFRTLAFVAGFSLVFLVLGTLFTAGTTMLGAGRSQPNFLGIGIPASRLISVVAGSIVIIFGVNMLFNFLGFLALEARFHLNKPARGYPTAFLFGMTFAAGWSPCIGPILASILLVAAQHGDPLRAASLLGAYSLGLGLPFIAASALLDRMTPLLKFFKRRAQMVRIASGLVLIALGLSMVFGRLSSITSVVTGIRLIVEDFTKAHPPIVPIAIIGTVVLVGVLLLISRRKRPR